MEFPTLGRGGRRTAEILNIAGDLCGAKPVQENQGQESPGLKSDVSKIWCFSHLVFLDVS